MKKSILPILYFTLVSTISFAQSSDWKQEARKRIDSIRKNDFTIQITDSKGNPLSDVTLDIKLVKHDFYIGAVVDDDFITSKHSDVYKSNLLKYFNSSGFENALKQKRRNTEVEKNAEQTAEWFSQNGISFRGHALVYDGEKFLRPAGRNQAEVRNPGNWRPAWLCRFRERNCQRFHKTRFERILSCRPGIGSHPGYGSGQRRISGKSVAIGNQRF